MIKSTTGTSNSIMLPAFPSGQHANYSDEICRLITYREMDKEGFFHAVSMAKSGLYYTGRGDSVRCYSCLTKISNWNAQNINPDLLHCGLAPECRHLAHQDETNQPIVYPDDVTTDKICRYLQLQYEKLSHNPTQVYRLLSRRFNAISCRSNISFDNGDSMEHDNFPCNRVNSSTMDLSSIFMNCAGLPFSEHSSRIQQSIQHDISTGSVYSPYDHLLLKCSLYERLHTFANFPVSAQVHPLVLAEAGFFYTGQDDRVRCAFCNGSLQDWQSGDQPVEEHAKHFPTCSMERETQSHGAISENRLDVFIVSGRENCDRRLQQDKHSSMDTESARMSTFNDWPNRETQPPLQLAKAGFFYSGFSDSVTCFACGGGLRNWEPDDEPWHEHARWFPHCSFMRQEKGSHFVDEVLSGAGVAQTQEDLPLQQNAFDGVSWKVYDTELMKNGMPEVLVRSVMSLYEGAKTRVRVDLPDRESMQSEMSVSHDHHHHSLTSRGVGGSEAAVQSERVAVDGRRVEECMKTGVVQAVLALDVPTELVKRAVELRLSCTGSDFPSVEFLMDHVFELGASQQQASQHGLVHHGPSVNDISQHGLIQLEGGPRFPPMVASCSTSGTHSVCTEAPTKSLVEENRQLREQRTCKICMDEDVCIVFVPCGHLVCCATCAAPLHRCPVCRSTVRGTVRTYMS